MNDELSNLMKLQEADLKIFGLEQDKSHLPEKLKGLKEGIAQAKNTVEGLQRKLVQVEEDKVQVEKDIVREKELLEKSQERLGNITTNREYDAVHGEIDTHQSKVKGGEDRILSLAEEQETISEEQKTTEENFQQAEEKTKPEIEKLTADIAEIDGRIAQAQAERDDVAKGISQKAMRVYSRILKGRKNNQALGFVSDGNRACSYCHKTLTLQQFNEVRRMDEMIVCDSCGSILLWTE